MFKYRKNQMLLSALGAALSAGASAVVSAFDHVEEEAVGGLLRVTHAITEQVCEFKTVDEIETFLRGVADRHHWQIPNLPAAAAAPAVDTATPGETHVEVDLGQLRAAVAADNAAASAETAPDSASDAAAAAAFMLPESDPAADVGLQGNEAAVETKTYSDGSSATGTAPLPDQSPAEQDAAAANVAQRPDMTETPAAIEQPADTTAAQ